MFTRWGTPAAVVTDNGAIFTATPRRGGRSAPQDHRIGELAAHASTTWSARWAARRCAGTTAEHLFTDTDLGGYVSHRTAGLNYQADSLSRNSGVYLRRLPDIRTSFPRDQQSHQSGVHHQGATPMCPYPLRQRRNRDSRWTAQVVDNTHRGSSGRRPRSAAGNGAARRGARAQAPGSAPGHARRAQLRPEPEGDAGPQGGGPVIPPGVEAKQLAAEVRRELSTLDRVTADIVARHLVAAGELLADDPEAALDHARAARSRSARIAAVREAVAIAAYQCGDWAQALAELRAARRMGSKSELLALIADCERGLGRPERAIELARGPEAAKLTGDDADELRIVAAGARADLGQLEQALTVLSTPQLDPNRTGSTPARLFYAYAETLLALGRGDEALQWFLRSAAADVDGVTDAEDRVSELA